MTEPGATALIWLRRDLRLADNPALSEAIQLKLNIIPVFIWAPEEEAPWQPGAASRVWLHHELSDLSASLKEKGSRLILRKGASQETLESLIKATGAKFVFWNRLYEPSTKSRDEKIKQSLKSLGIDVRSFNASLLHEPWEVSTGQKNPYQVFTPYWKACLQLEHPEPLKEPRDWSHPITWPSSDSLSSFQLLPTQPRWDKEIESDWKFGEREARQSLKSFLKSFASQYEINRDIPSTPGTSRISPALHFGSISPRQIWSETKKWMKDNPTAAGRRSAQVFLKEIGWREFAHHVLFHFPHTPHKPLRSEFQNFPWKAQPKFLRAWQRGQTGVPIVDAGMRQLWKTGWMHNRVRMIVASFLTKHLLISWKEGAHWFWDTLVDADLASNTLGWQWAGGCGADAAPYFRIFNPVLQGEKFDPEGAYVKTWVPELKELSPRFIHSPWNQVHSFDYPPQPVIQLQEGRDRALEAFAEYKTKKAAP